MTLDELTFDGRVAVITGSGSGLGREHALLLAARGARVVVNDVDLSRATETANEITTAGGTAIADGHNVVDGAVGLIGDTLDSFGQLDIVINNAGISRHARFDEMPGADWWAVFDTHLRGTVEVSRAAMPYLAASGSGRLINISSSAMLGAAEFSAYGAAKAAIWGLGNALEQEFGGTGLQVTTVQPSAWTPMTESAFDNPAVIRVLREKLAPSAVSAFVAWLAHQDTKVHGECFQCSGISAGRTAFGAMPRIRAAAPTPEAWAEASEELMKDGALSALRSTNESFRAELVFLDPSMDEELPLNAAEATAERN
ncbi:SDR family NAD(P)-dependent oxidoreductase [Actinomycetes bacterium M1A6_2h]